VGCRSPKRISCDGSLPAEPHQGIASRWVGTGETTGEHLVAKKVAGPRDVCVGGILAPLGSRIDKKPPHLRPWHCEERTHECHAVAELTGPLHTPQSVKSSAPENPVKNRFGLVVGSVSHEHMPAAAGMSDIGQKRVAETSGPGLEAFAPLGSIVADRQLSSLEFQPETGCQPLDEPTVGGSLDTEIVLGMGHDDRHAQEPLKSQEQSDAVASPRHSHDDRKPARAAAWQPGRQGCRE
jgi:hypothetical protein